MHTFPSHYAAVKNLVVYKGLLYTVALETLIKGWDMQVCQNVPCNICFSSANRTVELIDIAWAAFSQCNHR